MNNYSGEDAGKPGQLKTIWEVRHYDVWGNEKDGFDVNDSWCIHRQYQMFLTLNKYNKGTSSEFKSATPTDDQIREALDIKSGWPIETDGDAEHIYVRCGKTDEPLGELSCISHQLSPIKMNENFVFFGVKL